MINKLDEKLKEYSHKYFVKEFMKCKPNTKYNKIERKFLLSLVIMCVMWVLSILSIIFWKCLGFWFLGLSFLFLIVSIFCFGKLFCRKTKMLSEMASAYLEKHRDLKKKILDRGLLTTERDRKYVNTIENTYRVDIVKRYLGENYNINVIKALKDEINIKCFKFDLDFIPVCSLVALSIAVAAWEGSRIQQGWPIAVLSFFFLLIGYAVYSVVRVLVWDFKCKKYKILRETLSFMLYDYM